MPLTGLTPDIGSQVVASAQTLVQRNFIISRNFVFGDDPASKGGEAREKTWVTVRGLPRVRVQLFLSSTYSQSGKQTFFNLRNSYIARNYIAWRLVSPFPGQRLVSEAGDNVWREFTPITSPQLLPVGVPIDVTVPVGGLYAVAIEFDTSSGTSLANQGYDRVLISISAA